MNKRIVCLLLALALCLSLTACKREQQTNPTNSTNPAIESEPVLQTETSPTGAPADSNIPDSTESTQHETVGTPAVQETLPPDADVSIGVVEGVGGSDIDTDSQDGTSAQKPTEATGPEGSESQIDSSFDITRLTYEGFNALSGEDQRKVVDMFGSADDFIRWYKAVEAQYKAEHPDIEIGDGTVNGEDITGG